ncbi:MAG: L-2-hydroxyglutarate oxidase [bacterium]|nr:L-2-hydroxyglutarate oxidase [bacterium]
MDFLIVGAGIAGMFTAYNILEKYQNKKKIIIIDKEKEIGIHASGKNSGVIHAGIYYTPDSLKAKFCIEGNKFLTDYCMKNGIPINKVGKLIVPTCVEELRKLHDLHDRAKRNGAQVELVSQKQAKEIEPKVKVFEEAIWSPKTSTIDPMKLIHKLYEQLLDRGVSFLFNCKILSLKPLENMILLNTQGKNVVLIWNDKFINCAGLYADIIAKKFGLAKNYIILPFRGIYYQINKKVLNTNVYPVPTSKYFLGIHWTVYEDKTKVGPNAFPAFWRENYQALKNFSITELVQTVSLNTILLLKSKEYRFNALKELKKIRKQDFIEEAFKLVQMDSMQNIDDFIKAVPGIRAQILNLKDFKLEDDFIVENTENSVHILNIVSPGLTASYPLTKMIVEKFI